MELSASERRVLQACYRPSRDVLSWWPAAIVSVVWAVLGAGMCFLAWRVWHSWDEFPTIGPRSANSVKVGEGIESLFWWTTLGYGGMGVYLMGLAAWFWLALSWKRREQHYRRLIRKLAEELQLHAVEQKPRDVSDRHS